jgi:serine/threonine protein kinase/tetratricopeptide (TPR) repeat protein
MTERDLFLHALEIADLAERAAFLDRTCGDDHNLRRQVEELLRAHHRVGGFLEQVPSAGDASEHTHTYDLPPQPTERPGTIIAGRYKLLQQIGQGGMGSVWMADQLEPVKRRVAVKLIRTEREGSRTILSRFEAERQAIALMDHPNIARLLEAGNTAGSRSQEPGDSSQESTLTPPTTPDPGRPYFVMELVKGTPLTAFCDEHKLSVPMRLDLFLQICSAVQHAHQKGIIHRDLKPNNILVEMHDDKPVPKVIDFGLAKALSGQPLTEHTLFTGFGTVAGTPLYMAPEQAKFNAIDIDTRADVYALGVILYELLTGSTPIERQQLKAAALDEVLRVIRESEPPTPSKRLSSTESKPSVAANRQMEPVKLSRFLRGDLDWIVMKALAKERDRRYESATGLARDVERFLNHEPVLAGPPTMGYKLRKFIRRNRPQVIAAALVVLALVLGMAGTTFGLIRAEHRRVEADEARKREEQRAEGERKAKLEAEAREAEIAAVLKFVETRVFAAARPKDQSGGLGYDVKLADAVKAALPSVATSFPNQPLIEARLRMTIGTSFWHLGDPKTAIEQFQAARDLNARHRGPDDPYTLGCMNDLANSYAIAGRMHDAVALFEQTRERRKARLGADHPDTLATTVNLALGYGTLGRVSEAIKLHEEVLPIMKARMPDHPFTFNCMEGLALAYHGGGRSREAVTLFEEVFQSRRARVGAGHPELLSSMNNLAGCYAALGRAKEALKLLEEVVQLRKEWLGPDHADTLSSMNNLVNSYTDAGRLADSLSLLKDTLERRQRRVAAEPGNPMEESYLAWTFGQIGEAEEARHDYAAAVAAYSRSVELFEKLDRAGALKRPFFRDMLTSGRPRLAQCRKADQAVRDLNFALRQPAAEVPRLLDIRLQALAVKKDEPGVVATAQAYARLAEQDIRQVYNAACAWSLAASLAQVRGAEAPPLAEEYAGKALTLLKKTPTGEGHSFATPAALAAHMKQDRDLDSLRNRPDFKALLAQLEGK